MKFWLRLISIMILIGLMLFTDIPILASNHKVSSNTISDHILVKFKTGVSTMVAQEIHNKHGASTIKKIEGVDVEVVEVPEGTITEQVEAYRNDPNVEYAEPDYILEAIGSSDDPNFSDQWGMTQIQGPEAWDITYGNSDIIVAILDTGIDQDHEDLATKIVTNQNFTSSSNMDDLNGHGTHTAGIAAAITNNGKGVAGIGYNSSLMNIKVLDDTGHGTDSTVAAGITWATDNGAKVINLSLGGTDASTTLQNAVDYAWNHGVVVVAAAGNQGSNSPNYPAYYTHCIAVAATDQNDAKASFSNYGDWVDVAAPGVSIVSTLPNHDSASGILNYGQSSGTSMAAPFVSGLAALVWSTSYGTDNQMVVNRIESTADQISGTGTKWQYGRINANKAVKDSAYPFVCTLAATNITRNYATLNGKLVYKGNASTVNISFDWGTNKGGPYPNNTTSEEKTTTGQFSAEIVGLAPNQTYYYRAKAVGATTVYGEERSFTTIPLLSGKIAFTSNRDNKYTQIFRMNTDSSNQTQLTFDLANHYSPAIAPDGKKIAFVYQPDNSDGLGIALINIDGSSFIKLTDASQVEPMGCGLSWSPDGSKLVFAAYVSDSYLHICTLNSDGSNLQKLTNGSFTDSHPCWSPDGSKIAFVSNRDGRTNEQIFSMNTDGSNQVRISGEINKDIFGLSWSPDGSKIIYDTFIPDSQVAQGIFTMNPDGTERVSLPFIGALQNATLPVWSPDGIHIAFQSATNPSVIYRANSDGSDIYQLTFGNDKEPSWGISVDNSEAPVVKTSSYSDITPNSVTLNGSLIYPGTASSVQVSFEWGTDTNYGQTTTPQTLNVKGDFKADITGLSPYIIYHFRAKADGGDYGVTYGEDMTFKTKSISPIVAIGSATAISSSMATVSGTLDDLGDIANVKVFFEYGTSTSYGGSTAIQTLQAPGGFSASLTNLKSDMIYHFRVKAEGKDTVYSQDNTFKTLPPPLGITTSTPSGISTTTATLRGTLSGLGDEVSVKVYFEWGLTTEYGNVTTPQVLDRRTDFNTKITIENGLTAMKTYHYRATAEGTHNKVYGEDKSFVAKTTVPSGGGGGGGSVYVPRFTAVTLSGFTSTTALKVDTTGAVQQSVELKMAGGASLNILKNTKLTDSTGKALKIVTAANLTSMPEPPMQYTIIQGYEFGPTGTKFEPAPVLTFKYDPLTLPAGVTEDKLCLAYWNGSQWVNLESLLDKSTGTISAKINHFSDYALLGELPPPAKFDFSEFNISKETVNTGEPVTIHTLVTNTGGRPGENDIILKIDGTEYAKVKVELSAGEFQNVVFQVIRDASGEYKVDVNGQTGMFNVVVPQPVIPEISPEPPGTIAEMVMPSNTPVSIVTDNPQSTSPVSNRSVPILWSMLIIAGILGLIGGLVIVRRRRKSD